MSGAHDHAATGGRPSIAAAIKAAARERGFALAGIAPAAPLPDDLARLTRWIDAGHHGAMAWIADAPARRADVRASLPAARSVVMLGFNYYQGARDEPPPPPGHGRVARYARGRDYHDLLGARLDALAGDVARLAGHPVATRPFVDAAPLLERAFAERAGLGFVGKNTCLIDPATGSWFFLAALATDLDLPADDPIDGTCGRCTRCLDACPTHAFAAPWELDARRCISYLTIEWREAIEDEALAAGLGDWAFGCDVCQDVCPYNKHATPTTEAALLGPATVDLRALLAIRTNEEFNRALAGSPMGRARRRGLQRTAAELLVNEAAARPGGGAAAGGSGAAAEAGGGGSRGEALRGLAAEFEGRAAEERENAGLAASWRTVAARARRLAGDGA